MWNSASDPPAGWVFDAATSDALVSLVPFSGTLIVGGISKNYIKIFEREYDRISLTYTYLDPLPKTTRTREIKLVHRPSCFNSTLND